jgi:hypothetical protein
MKGTNMATAVWVAKRWTVAWRWSTENWRPSLVILGMAAVAALLFAAVGPFSGLGRGMLSNGQSYQHGFAVGTSYGYAKDAVDHCHGHAPSNSVEARWLSGCQAGFKLQQKLGKHKKKPAKHK